MYTSAQMRVFSNDLSFVPSHSLTYCQLWEGNFPIIPFDFLSLSLTFYQERLKLNPNISWGSCLINTRIQLNVFENNIFTCFAYYVVSYLVSFNNVMPCIMVAVITDYKQYYSFSFEYNLVIDYEKCVKLIIPYVHTERDVYYMEINKYNVFSLIYNKVTNL